jgi:hypothetical protein
MVLAWKSVFSVVVFKKTGKTEPAASAPGMFPGSVRRPGAVRQDFAPPDAGAFRLSRGWRERSGLSVLARREMGDWFGVAGERRREDWLLNFY